MPTVTYTWDSTVGSFYLNDQFTSGNQGLPAISSINGGAYYFGAWDDPSGAIEGRIVSSTGTPTGTEFLVNSTTANIQTDPSIAQLVSTSIFSTYGSIIVTYTDYSVDPGGDILARFVSSGSSIFFPTTPGTLGNEISISTSSSDDTDSDVAALSDGGFVVSFTRNFGGGDLDTRAAIFNSDGSVRVAQVNGDTSIANAGSHTQVAGLTNGNFVMVWEQEPVAGGNSQAWFAIYNGTTGAVVSAAASLDSIGSINEDLQVVALQDGGFAIAYTDNGWSIDQTEITLRIFNADGSTRSNYIRVNTTTAGVQDSPTLTTLSNGYIVVGWNNGDALMYQAYTPTGTAIGTEFTVATFSIEGEIAGLTGGLVANVRESSLTDDGGDNSIRSSVHDLVRTTVGDATNETLVGDRLRDIINGGAGDDTITGGLNVDILTGGLGLDRFSDSAANFNGDSVTDFSLGDRIQIVDGAVGGTTYNLSGSTLTFYSSTVTVSGVNASDRLIVRPATVATGVELLLVNAEFDFNGDGRSDQIFLDASNNMTVWRGQTNGSFVATGGLAANALDASWRIVGIGDFNGDGRDDILWRQSGGTIGEWLGQAGVFTNNSGAAANPVDNSWSVVGIADFNGDGRDDILWRHTSGQNVEWLAQANGSFANNGNAPTIDTSWSVMATADFNGDGRADVLWRHSSGAFAEWQGQANGSFVNIGTVLAGATGSVVGSGDFNGDGREDILFRNSGTGAITVWVAQPTGQFSSFTPGLQVNDLNWKITSIGDFNGDGRDDLIWRHTNGTGAEWLGSASGEFVHNGAVPTITTATVQSPDIFIV